MVNIQKTTNPSKNDSTRKGEQYLQVKELTVGGGNSVFKIIGGKVFAGSGAYNSATFKLDPITGAVVITGAITATSGSITGAFSVTGALTIGTNGSISKGKTSYASTAAGFWLDNRFHIGSGSNYFKFDGTDVSMGGGTITGGTIQTDTTGYRTVISEANIEFYNSATRKGFFKPDSTASIMIGSADEIYMTDLSENPNFKFSSAGHITLNKSGAKLLWANNNTYWQCYTDVIETNGKCTVAGYVKTKDKFYVDSDAGETGTFLTDLYEVTVKGGIITNISEI